MKSFLWRGRVFQTSESKESQETWFFHLRRYPSLNSSLETTCNWTAQALFCTCRHWLVTVVYIRVEESNTTSTPQGIEDLLKKMYDTHFPHGASSWACVMWTKTWYTHTINLTPFDVAQESWFPHVWTKAGIPNIELLTMRISKHIILKTSLRTRGSAWLRISIHMKHWSQQQKKVHQVWIACGSADNMEIAYQLSCVIQSTSLVNMHSSMKLGYIMVLHYNPGYMRAYSSKIRSPEAYCSKQASMSLIHRVPFVWLSM